MSAAPGINDALVFDGALSSTAPITSQPVTLTEVVKGTTFFVAPSGDTVGTVLQVRDPLGDWHTFTENKDTISGACNALVVPLNAGHIRAVMTPAAGTGTLRVWVQSSGG